MGIVGTAHDWFTSYLQGRSQCVDIGGNLSEFLSPDTVYQLFKVSRSFVIPVLYK
jgi:hypothetical protein